MPIKHTVGPVLLQIGWGMRSSNQPSQTMVTRRATEPSNGDATGHSRITTTTVAVSGGGGGQDGIDGTCSAAFGQCGGKNWNGPTCCETGCHCRSEGEWYSQCAPPAGSHRCGGTIMFDEQVQEGPVVGGVARTVSPNLLMACVAMMFVMGASLVAFKLRRRRQQPSCDGKGIPQLLSSHEEDVEGLQ